MRVSTSSKTIILCLERFKTSQSANIYETGRIYRIYDYDSFLLIKTGNGLDPVTADVS